MDEEVDKEQELTLPENCPGVKMVQRNNLIWFIGAHQDESPPNPAEDWDGFGKFHSLSTRHMNFNEDCPQILDDDVDAVALSYYEHSGCIWFVKDSQTPGGVEFQWDGVRFAGVWEPDECVSVSVPTECNTPELRRAWMVKQAVSACETYTSWCNGEVYGFSIGVFKIREHEKGVVFDDEDDYRHDDPVYDDSCFGFYGWSDFETQAKEAIGVAKKEVDMLAAAAEMEQVNKD